MYSKLKLDERNASLKVMLVRSLVLSKCMQHPHICQTCLMWHGLLIQQQLISSLHDICQYLCAHARLGSSHARLGSQKLEFSGVTADWGGTEGIGKLFNMTF